MRALLVAGVLGMGTVLVFAAAALTATLFPHGSTVASQWGAWNGGPVVRGGWDGGIVPVPAPLVVPVPAPPMVEGDVAIPDPAFKALPGDTVPADDGGVILEAVPQP